MAESEPTSSADPLVALARELGSRALKSRSGLGALRQHESVARDTVRLILESSIFHNAPQLGTPWPWLGMDPEDLFHFVWHRSHARGRFVLDLIGGALVHPASFDPRPVWALFWALVRAEHEFLTRFVPYWSHEERLTGHLVSQIGERVHDFGPHWTTLCDGMAAGSDAKPPRCEIQYFDTATARQEKVTGADLGLIIHAEYPWHDEFFKVARFQAKKADGGGKAAIDLDQMRALTSADGLGYYVFYHQARSERGTPCPTVRPAQAFNQHLDEASQRPGGGPRSGSRPGLGVVTVDALDSGWDFASFVTFALADPASSFGLLRDSPERARGAVCESENTNISPGTPSRVMVVTLGMPPAVDWDHMLGEWFLGG